MPDENLYIGELKKFVGQEVTVKDAFGAEYSGTCVAIGWQHLNIVLRTETEKIVLKNISSIRRKRSNPEKEKKEGEKHETIVERKN